ncbi:AfsA-related hotdog domain-containing protein [Streptomyces sp. NPDC046866]|uniref:AfsA-related hotdog domain-containing protein n=1 Tax=Streptomyces sp. NPDC046866 TaxID=3154921 RepID=UPI003456EB8C
MTVESTTTALQSGPAAPPGTGTAETTELGHGTAVRHLIHCPPSWDRYLLEAPGSSEEHFVLAGDLPTAHPLFNDGPGLLHDPQLLTETLREVGEFVGHQYFGVPQDRPGLFHRFALDLTGTAPWRTVPAAGPGPSRHRARLLTRLAVRPTHSLAGVPRGLEFRLEAAIDDVLCATGTAGLVFLTPALHRSHIDQSRRALRAAPAEGAPYGESAWPVPAAEVGRRSEANVVVREDLSAPAAPDRLSTWIVPQPDRPLFAGPNRLDTKAHGGGRPAARNGGRSAAAEREGEGKPEVGGLSALLLLEGMRQSALLAAARSGAVDVDRAVLGSFDVRLTGYAADDLPLRCTVVSGPGAHRREREAALTVTQNGRPVADARARVVQDQDS